MKKRKAPFTDLNGNNIYERDQIRHPDGTIAVVVYDTNFKNYWRAVYADEESLWLGNQVGNKGRAVVMKDKPKSKMNSKTVTRSEMDKMREEAPAKILEMITISSAVSKLNTIEWGIDPKCVNDYITKLLKDLS
jgi:hypothetical protein